MARGRKPSKGLGDTVEKVLEATGIAQAVKFIAGDDCGCDARKEKLNQWFPYRKAECLTEDEYNYLTEYFAQTRNEINVSQQQMLLKIYNRIFNANKKPTSCSSCFRELHSDLAKVYNTYKEENNE
jgi:NAD(P)H-nitrite reductase large subunit